MITTNICDSTKARYIKYTKGNFSILEFEREMSVRPEEAEMAYFASQMDVRKRQLVVKISPDHEVVAQKGTMQLMLGDIMAKTDVSDAGDLLKKVVGSKVTGEKAIKPRYTGEGMLVLEPTFRYIILEDLKDWDGEIVVEDGMFLACDGAVDIRVSARTNLSSAVLGGEGLFNTTLIGQGVVALESPMPRDELFEVNLVDDVAKIDGNMAIAWTRGLDFTVERTTPTLFGSMVSGEGLVNTYRGTGKILVAPVQNNRGIASPSNKK
ncbi:MAG: AIM24 family protein [Lachnospiraceae bacterium]|nr:AIM24 family protein [Lachnospiraceae bacterium]